MLGAEAPCACDNRQLCVACGVYIHDGVADIEDVWVCCIKVIEYVVDDLWVGFAWCVGSFTEYDIEGLWKEVADQLLRGILVLVGCDSQLAMLTPQCLQECRYAIVWDGVVAVMLVVVWGECLT